MLTCEGVGQSFINSLTVTLPATVIPILIAAIVACAIAWMEGPARHFLFAIVVGLLVAPLQMSLIPLLRRYNGVGSLLDVNAKDYLGIWFAHTAFGLPWEIFESARVDGAIHYQIFTKMVFLGKSDSQIVMTSRLHELLGSRGDNREILTASAFVSIIVPLLVFFSLQRYFVRGLLAGSVKGG